MTNKNIKITCYVTIAVFLLLNTAISGLRLMSAISYSVTVAALFDLAYDRFLWRYNPLEKTPKIYGTYKEESCSTYKGGYPYKAKAIIHQTLSKITVYEEIRGSGYAESITASLIPPASPDGKWKLYYTYLTHPPANKQDDMHEGTVILQIKSENILEGTYFTNRTDPTRGDQKLVRISRRTK